MAGRRPKYNERMKPNGLPAELDTWLSQYAISIGKRGAQLKREILEEFRRVTLLQQAGIATAQFDENPAVETIDPNSVGGDSVS